MKKIDKTLLLKDLYAKSLYNVHCCVYNLNGSIREENDVIYYCAAENVVTLNSTSKGECYMYYQIKPYLRPLSSMTEKEAKLAKDNGCIIYYDTTPNSNSSILVIASPKGFDWLNSHFFDYRGLIENGLALEAPEGMYKFE